MESTRPSAHRHRRTDLYGAGAFVCVVLTCFFQFAFISNIQGTPARVIWTFVLGAIYTSVAILGHCFDDTANPKWNTARFLFQCAVGTAMIFVSPVLGYFNVILLPLVSEAYFDFKWPAAFAATAYLFLITVGVFAYRYGAHAIPEAALNFVAAFAFTIAFTLLTRQALRAKEQAEKLHGELTAAHQQLQAYAAQAEDLATTRERNRLAREIHDGIGHYLTVVKTQLDAATALMPTQPERARDAVAKAAKLTGEALDDVRRSVGALRTDAPRPPITDTVKELAAHGEPVPAITIEGDPRPLAPAIEHALFRAAQEGLTNIRKHARATTALVRLDFREPQRVRLELSDNGVGAAGQPTGFGLTGIRERIEVLGGKVESGNRAGGGFVLTVEVPT
jgi:signal transduction histidine kinase